MNEHRTALKNQARSIRLVAQELERFADTFDDNRDLLEPVTKHTTGMPLIFIQRKLGEMQSVLDALDARFGRRGR